MVFYSISRGECKRVLSVSLFNCTYNPLAFSPLFNSAYNPLAFGPLFNCTYNPLAFSPLSKPSSNPEEMGFFSLMIFAQIRTATRGQKIARTVENTQHTKYTTVMQRTTD